MMEVGCSRKKKQVDAQNFAELIFSWSLDDILNENLYKHKVENMPLTFQSEEQYLGSFGYPLLEQTRAEILSSMEIMYRAPFAEIFSINDSKGGENMVYDVNVGPWRNLFSERGKDAYHTLPGDLLILADGKPESIADLQRVGRTWAISMVTSIADNDNDDDRTSIYFEVKASQPVEFREGMFVVFLVNITTHKRIWNSLHMNGNLNIIKELAQLDDLVNGNSVLFEDAKWKVLFSDGFQKSFGKLPCLLLKKLVLHLLLRLSGGWRPKSRSVDLYCESSAHILRQFEVEGLYVICTTDIIKEVNYIQVLKVWDILPLEEIPKLTKRLKNIFSAYTEAYISRCTAKRLEGNLEVPTCWPASQHIVQFRYLDNDAGDGEVSMSPGNHTNCVENSKVSESLLLMKFYSLSRWAVSHLLSGKEVDLLMQVTDEQMDIILFCKSSFIIGRSGTGKTTILTMKLFQNEQKFRVATDRIFEAESSQIRDEVVDDPEISKPSVLRQLFVTVSPRLCHAVKRNVSHLTSISSNGSSSAEINLDEADIMSSEFDNIPDTFVDIDVRNYPLVITFHKFLMMLDGTLGNSFFERFVEARESVHGNHVSSRFVALQTFIRLREVTFDRFCSFYWPHFNYDLTKKLDPSRVFTEIISHIKGGLQAAECINGKLSYADYCLLAENRSSTLTKQKRQIIYTLFQAYEKMKTERGDFDLGDFVNDLHHRFRNRDYKGDKIDFVYIDEVQDLSMRQISLFKYICHNVDEGFVFAGDTAQTIARGIDFRFQDIRSLFYKEFLTTKTDSKQLKGLVSDIFQLKQNFRTHAGVLEFAQSVIDILYCYFVHSIDILEPETSLISGEPPVLLELGSDENALTTIFGGGESGGEIVGFGAEQVILVRDECAKAELFEYVGKKALVLTIVECKGLEFEDVLLYNFFGTSPLKDQWRVIYGYMKERDWLDEKLPQSFPTFSESRHSVLCSELKQLYVAITRTRQRLWICENREELSKPMFEYWKSRGLVQVRKLDDSVAQAMRVASTPKEWWDRGIKLFYENNFVMATMCFERAGDTTWENMARASGLRASADQTREANPEAYKCYLREAAGIFESIGKTEAAASCYCDLGEYEIAGKVFLYKCGKIAAAAECFTLAGCYSEAAEAYAKGDQFSNCLSACKNGKLYDKGLQYIEYWKEHVNIQSKEIEPITQDFLESCAFDYHEHKDHKSMMKFVRAFCSMESKQMFLRSLDCLDELLLLEEESGHFLDAPELATSWDGVLKEADFLEKAGHYKEATALFLSYVFFGSLWGNENKGWPLKSFSQKEELSLKIKSLAKLDSDDLYNFVCCELEVLSDQHRDLTEMKTNLHSSRKYNNLRGEILSIRKILDYHFQLNSSKYDWEEELPSDTNKHCEEIFKNQVSVRTLVYYWNLWKQNVMDIFKSAESCHNEEPNKYEAHFDFSLIYLGVRKQHVKGNMVYLLVDKDADWMRNNGQKGVHRDRKRLTFDSMQLVCVMLSYWQSDLLSVGIKVLETLEGLNKSKLRGSAFHQSTSLLHIFEVAKFLLDCQYLNLTSPYMKKLQRFLGVSSAYVDLVFPLDWQNSVSENMISLRKTDLSINLLEDTILQNLDFKGDLTYCALGRVMMICLGSKRNVALYEHIINKIQQKPKWKLFVEKYREVGFKDISSARALRNALYDALAHSTCIGCISAHSFVYLMDRVHFMVSLLSGFHYTTKSSFVEWFTHLHSTDTPTKTITKPLISEHFKIFFMSTLQQVLGKVLDTLSWIQKSKIDGAYYHPKLALKLVMLMTLVCLEESDSSPILLELLTGRYTVSSILPTKFVDNLLKGSKSSCLNLNPDVVAQAFMSIGDPLLIVSSGDESPKIHAPCAIFVDLRKSEEEIMSLLFPTKTTHCAQKVSHSDCCLTICETPSDANLNVNSLVVCKGELQLNWNVIKEISRAINGKQKELLCSLPGSATIEKELVKNQRILEAVLDYGKPFARGDTKLVSDALNQMRRLSSDVFNMSEREMKHSIYMKSLQGIVKALQSSRRRIDDIVKRFAMRQESMAEQMVVSESSTSTTEVEGKCEEKNHVEGTGGDLQVELGLEKERDCGNMQAANSKKGKGNRKGKRSKKK